MHPVKDGFQQLMFLAQIVRRLLNFVLKYGVIGLGLGTFVESLGVPFADLPMQIAAGGLIKSGHTTFTIALLVSTTGLVLGSVASYYVGYYGNLFVHRSAPQKPRSRIMQRFAGSLRKHGFFIVAVAQLYGPMRTWISIPAGAVRMDLKRFVAASAIGGAIYCTLAILFSFLITQLVKDFISFFLPFTHYYALVGLATLLFLSLGIYLWVRPNR